MIRGARPGRRVCFLLLLLVCIGLLVFINFTGFELLYRARNASDLGTHKGVELGTGENQPHCKILRKLKPRLRTIAVVGNGPISKLQRRQISASDVVIRFNQMHNRFCGERLDIWVVRYASNVKFQYHGLNEIQHCPTTEPMGILKSIWFLDGRGKDREAAIQKVLAKFPQLRHKPWVAIDKKPLLRIFARDVNPTGSPSSGWAGMMLALECAPPNARVHLFGFNWSRRHWKAHNMDAEQDFAEKLNAEGTIVIHRPICSGLRTCGGCNVVQGYNSSHFLCEGQEGSPAEV
eukprot:jgi/Botrbrau1/21441/Bobra.0216s0049.1